MNDAATELSDRIGFAQMRSEGRRVRALALARLGRFDEAAAEVTEALAMDRARRRNPGVEPRSRGVTSKTRGVRSHARIAYNEAVETSHPRQVEAGVDCPRRARPRARRRRP